MGSRYLLLEFDDDEAAAKLQLQINEASLRGRPYRVIGLFAKPTKYCECDPKNHTTGRAGDATLKRGRKFGWWVCTTCKRPSDGLHGLVNLLKPSDIISPPTWVRGKHTFTHYISAISGLALGQQGREYWNTR